MCKNNDNFVGEEEKNLLKRIFKHGSKYLSVRTVDDIIAIIFQKKRVSHFVQETISMWT